MIVDRIAFTDGDDGQRTRTARVRHARGEFEHRIRIPADAAGPPEDGSAFLAAWLLPALWMGERELAIDAPVSPLLAGRTEALQRVYRGWAPQLRELDVRARGDQPAGEPAAGVGCFFSRGADSFYSVLRPRPGEPALTAAIFSDDFIPMQDRPTRHAELAEAQRAAGEVIGLPLVAVKTNIRLMTDEVANWGDVHAGVLASLALSLSGGFGTVVTPSTYSDLTSSPESSHPAVDPLRSTEAVAIVHDDLTQERAGKIRWLAEHRPDALAHLKVCFWADRTDNCGACRKCLLTMAALEASDALGRASQFPDRLDVDAVRALRSESLVKRVQWLEIHDALDPVRHAELRGAIAEGVRRSSRPGPVQRARLLVEYVRGRRPSPDPTYSAARAAFEAAHTNRVRDLLAGRLPGPRR